MGQEHATVRYNLELTEAYKLNLTNDECQEKSNHNEERMEIIMKLEDEGYVALGTIPNLQQKQHAEQVQQTVDQLQVNLDANVQLELIEAEKRNFLFELNDLKAMDSIKYSRITSKNSYY